MTSFDTNVLFFAYAQDRPEHPRAQEFLDAYSHSDEVVLCELCLIEFYRLLRNPVVLRKPLSAAEAVEVIQAWRAHPRWPVVGFCEQSKRLHDELWGMAARPGFAVRRIFDARLALVLRQHGVTEFATANVKDFEDFGFKKVWNPFLQCG